MSEAPASAEAANKNNGGSNGASRKSQLLVFAGIVSLCALAYAAYWFFYASRFISTDNAYTAVETAQVAATVGGTIHQVAVVDTQQVKQGEVLVRIDDADARLALTQAEAELERTVRRVKGYLANERGLAAQVQAREAEEKRIAAQLAAAEADFERARVDLDRRAALAQSGSVSGEELSTAQNAFSSAQAHLVAARAAVSQAQANRNVASEAREAQALQIADKSPETNPETVLARARRDQAKIDLERTVIRAPVDGVVVKRQVQLGQRVLAGAPLLAIVPLQAIHVDANFKEVQLEKVRVGQQVEVQADLYGNAVTYRGVVEGFSGGTGSAFAAIPAQNATGNWIKVVQRLPVRICLDPKELQANPLKVGLSMTVRIDTAIKN